ncbi:hypothetical protein [uncultured Gimesia sp.]|uniref:alpha/beta hydrolase family protein n=1 Tax=uncultured Gimesia sp. TaxID=1678688 RepID=UPI00261E3776|nr:hypothetical protein [uncultured Gimesia sp.]
MMRRLWSTVLDEILGYYLLHRYFYYKKRPLILSNAGETSSELHSGDLNTFFSPTPQAARLEYQSHLNPASQSTFDSAQIEDFQFPSSIQTGFPENDLVKGRHWKSTTTARGTDSKKCYTVVAVDGIVQMGVRSFNRLARRLTPAGIDVIMMDSPFNFRRTPEGYRPGQLIAGGNLDHQLTVARQGVLDLWSLILALQKEGRQIGLVGISHGAWMTLTAALLIEQLEFVMAITPPVDLFHILEEGGTVVKAIRRGVAHEPIDLDRLEQLSRPLVIANWTTKVPTSAIHLHVADYDRFIPSFRIEALAERWKTQSSHHPLGHIEATTGPKVVSQVSSDILHFWNLSQ